ncbi:MAG: discoidin domain-containing protein [Sedimentisphaerales bacterium]|nr:discoidin domain-containing protein [Sedimentisphaerales bacterium]
MQRRRSILTVCLGALLSYVIPASGQTPEVFEVSLAGTWRVTLDPNDVGVDEEWFTQTLSAPIQLPGTLRDNGYGDPTTAQTEWMSRLHDHYWYLRKDYKKYTEPNNVKVPFWLQPERKYTGVAWYQRRITIPESWCSRRAVVSFERAHWSTAVWLDDRQMGFNDSLGAPHVYDLGILEPGDYTLSVRVDNRYLVNIREDAHAITDSTQSNWHGLVGLLALTSTTPVWIEDARVYSDIARKTVQIAVDLGNATGRPGKGTLAAGGASVPVEWGSDGGTAELEVPLGDEARLWDEFDPALYRMTLRLTGQDADDRREFTVGLREIKSEDATFYVNGRKTFFRGTHEGCAFPLTGYPPTDIESWRKVFRVVKDYGLNHVRFHSWCPPEAAFTAADELGVYLQPECSNWGQYSSRDDTMEDFLYRETERIVKAYGNHPSFVMLSSGNEPAGPWQEILTPWLREWKQKDNRRIYASQTGRFYGNRPGPVDDIDYLVAIRIGSYRFRGDRAWHGGDWRRSLEGTNYPVISHETGQWCAYPSFADMDKYTGSLKPKNYEIFRESLAEHGMLDQAADFTRASGKFQVECYKQEIEALLRTPGMGGFQLLDLHDYPGQGTAVVGPLNVFWESKGYVTPEQFRRFCSETVPLARMDKYLYTADETLTVKIEMAHFGQAPLSGVVPTLKIVDPKGKAVIAAELATMDIPLGTAIPVHELSLSLGTFEAPQKYRLVVGLKGLETVENDWEFWVYPAAPPSGTPTDVLVTRSFAEAESRLSEGGKVLFLPLYNDLGWESPPIGRLPIFWNRLMGPGWDRFLGLLVDPNHPALAHFATDEHYDWQWQDVIQPACRAVNLDSLPRALHPIVQVIDDWNRNYKLGLVFECRVGAGKLMVCSADLEADLDSRPVARQLRRSLLAYMAGERFNPAVEVTPEQVRGVLFDNQLMAHLGAATSGGGSARNAIDGNPNTAWTAGERGGAHPYELTISFPQPVSMTGIICMNRQNQRQHLGDIRAYAIDVSDDGSQWRQVCEGELESTFEPQRVRFGAAVTAQHLRLRALSGFGPDRSCALAELAIFGATGAQITSGTTPYRNVRTATEEIEGPDSD